MSVVIVFLRRRLKKFRIDGGEWDIVIPWPITGNLEEERKKKKDKKKKKKRKKEERKLNRFVP